jgi:serine/threonine-protein kinase SRPK3
MSRVTFRLGHDLEVSRVYSLLYPCSIDIEDIHRYTTGGFHPICLGDVLSSTKAQYRVLHKLGRGSFSTVWLAEALQERRESIRHSSTILIMFYRHRYVALKICVAHADPKHELEIFNRLLRTPPAPPNVLQLQDHFSLQGPNGVHTVLVLNVLGSC